MPKPSTHCNPILFCLDGTDTDWRTAIGRERNRNDRGGARAGARAPSVDASQLRDDFAFQPTFNTLLLNTS